MLVFFQISIATFKLSKLELVQESKGLSSTIKLQVAEVNCEQCNAIPWDEFQVIYKSFIKKLPFSY